MAYKIEFSNEAINQLQNNLIYLVEHWSEKIAFEFLDILNFKIEIISHFPYSYSKSTSNQKIRKCVVTE
jgi:hypothetical protein